MNRRYNNAYGAQEPVMRIESVKKTVDNVYLNVVFDHPEYKAVQGSGGVNQPAYYVTSESPIDATYNVTKTEPILDKCSDYYASVVRFTIPLDEVPLGICDIIPNQGNPNLTPMILGIDTNLVGGPTTKYPVNCLYVAQNNLTTPIQNASLQVITPYYFIYSYDQYIVMFNVALSTAWTNSGLATIFPTLLPPYFYLDHQTNLVNLVVPECFIRVMAPLTIQPLIFMNAVTQNYLDAFNTQYVGYDFNGGNDVYFLLVQLDYPENYYYPNGTTVPTPTSPSTGLPTAPFYFKFSQQYSILEYWASLRKIVITTNTVPVRNEYIPTVNNLVGAINNMDTNGINNSLPIITDFIPQIDTSAGSSRSIAYYLPSAQYRLTDLLSDGPLQTLDIRILWQDKNGNLYPLQISVLQQASMKILFTKKSTYKG
jgi:hypothetical protein